MQYGATLKALARLTRRIGLAVSGLAALTAATANAAMPASPASAGSPPTRPGHVAALTAAEPLDLAMLAKRLRKTKAINLRTKLAVKNESEDLLHRFRAYHAEASSATLPELRRSYDSLFVKLCSLLEDTDPTLASEIDRSRAAIWAMLVDPERFATSAPAASASVARNLEPY